MRQRPRLFREVPDQHVAASIFHIAVCAARGLNDARQSRQIAYDHREAHVDAGLDQRGRNAQHAPARPQPRLDPRDELLPVCRAEQRAHVDAEDFIRRTGSGRVRKRVLRQARIKRRESMAALAERLRRRVIDVPGGGLRVEYGQHGLFLQQTRNLRAGRRTGSIRVELRNIANALQPLIERVDMGHQLDRRGRERKARLRGRAEHNCAAAILRQKLYRALKEHLAGLGQRLDFIEYQHGVGQRMEAARRRVGRGIAGVEELHQAGEYDVAVPALGQALVCVLLVLRLDNDIGMMLQYGGIVRKRLADVAGVLIEDGVVGNDVEQAPLPVEGGVSERIAQAGKRLAAARRHGQCDDARFRRSLLPA